MTSPTLNTEEKDHLPQPAVSAFPSAAQNAGFLCMKAHCWLMFNSMSTRKPSKSHSTELLSSHLATTGTGRPWHCLLLNIMGFLSAQFSSLSRSISIAVQPFGVYYCVANPSSFCKFAEGARCSITRLLTKRLNSTGLSISPWGTHQLVTCLQLNFVL